MPRRRASRRAAWCVVAPLALVLVLTFVTPAGAQDEEPEGEAFFGTLVFEEEPVAGVTITATDLDGVVVGQGVSADDGTWRVELPGPGRYRATIEVDSLPEGVDLRNPERETLEVDVRAGRPRPLQFALGERTSSGTPTGERFLQAVVNGLRLGLIIALASVGLSLIFGTTGLINFAHGELVTFGAVIAWYFNARGPELPLIWAGIVALLIAGMAGATLETGMFRPLRRIGLGPFQFVVVTIGLSLLARHLILLWFDPEPRSFVDYVVQKEWDIGPIGITPRDFTIMVASALVLVLVATALTSTRIGNATRAVADNVDLARASGINVNQVTLTVWIAGASLAALGGIFLGSTEVVDWLMGFRLLLLMFAAVILGGLGTAYGAMAGGVLIGLVTEVTTVWVSPELKTVWALIVLVLVLLVRPQGILGHRERVG